MRSTIDYFTSSNPIETGRTSQPNSSIVTVIEPLMLTVFQSPSDYKSIM